ARRGSGCAAQLDRGTRPVPERPTPLLAELATNVAAASRGRSRHALASCWAVADRRRGARHVAGGRRGHQLRHPGRHRRRESAGTTAARWRGSDTPPGVRPAAAGGADARHAVSAAQDAPTDDAQWRTIDLAPTRGQTDAPARRSADPRAAHRLWRAVARTPRAERSGCPRMGPRW